MPSPYPPPPPPSLLALLVLLAGRRYLLRIVRGLYYAIREDGTSTDAIGRKGYFRGLRRIDGCEFERSDVLAWLIVVA